MKKITPDNVDKLRDYEGNFSINVADIHLIKNFEPKEGRIIKITGSAGTYIRNDWLNLRKKL